MHQRYCAEISTTTSLSTQKSPVPLPSMQPSISASLQNADIRKSNNATVEMAIADFFHSKNIADAVVELPRFARLVRVCRLIGDDFVLPNRKKIGGELLDLNYESTYKTNKDKLLKEANIFGLSFIGNGTTIKRMPLMNVLAMTATVPPVTVAIQDCTAHMEEGGKKDAVYVASLFEDKVKEFDPKNHLTDVFFFDGASNVQKAGDLLMAKYPCTFCFHGGEHVVSLFFSSIAKIKPIKVCISVFVIIHERHNSPFFVFQLLILKTCRIYNVFGSGANHGIYVQFMGQSSLANGGKKVGLLHGAGTRMAMWFYAMIRLLCLEQPLKAMIHQQKFVDLHLNESAWMAVHDIKEAKFWKCLYIILRCVFPALKALCYCDANKPSMDKIFFLSHRTTVAIEQSMDALNDDELFGDLSTDRNLMEDGNNMLGGEDDSNEEEVFFEDNPDFSDDDDIEDRTEATPYNLIMSFGRQVLWHWNRRKKRIEHEYAITGWALSVVDEVRKDVRARMRGEHRDAIESVVRHLHVMPCANTNTDVLSMTPVEIVDQFWNEFKSFQNCNRPYNVRSRWATQDVAQGRSYLWHEKYSLPYTSVLGFVACHVTSKLCGIGPAERSWGGVKQIKTGQRSHLSGESTEKRSIIYISSKIEQARIHRNKMEKIDAAGQDAMFGNEDFAFDLHLEQFGVDTAALRQPVVQRIFRAYVEDWEQEARKKNDCVAEARLLAKYKGLVFVDPDTGMTFSVYDKNMEFRRGRGNGWFVLAVSSDQDTGDDNNNEYEAFLLEVACEVIGDTPQSDGIIVVHEG